MHHACLCPRAGEVRAGKLSVFAADGALRVPAEARCGTVLRHCGTGGGNPKPYCTCTLVSGYAALFSCCEERLQRASPPLVCLRTC